MKELFVGCLFVLMHFNAKSQFSKIDSLYIDSNRDIIKSFEKVKDNKKLINYRDKNVEDEVYFLMHNSTELYRIDTTSFRYDFFKTYFEQNRRDSIWIIEYEFGGENANFLNLVIEKQKDYMYSISKWRVVFSKEKNKLVWSQIREQKNYPIIDMENVLAQVSDCGFGVNRQSFFLSELTNNRLSYSQFISETCLRENGFFKDVLADFFTPGIIFTKNDYND